MNVRLVIDYKECQLSKEEVIALSYGVNRLTDIQSRQGYYSNTFRLPKTPTNLEIFGYPDQLNATDTKRFQRLTAWIESDGVQVVYGFAQLQSVSDELEVVVKGGNSDWIDLMIGKTVDEIDLSDLDHIQNLANVVAARFNDYTSHYVYPDIDYGMVKNLNGSISHLMLFPSVFIKTIIDRSFSEAGLTLNNVLDSVTLYQQLVMPFSNDEMLHSSAWVTKKGFRVHVPAHTIDVVTGAATWYAGIDNDSTGGFFDNDNQITLGAWDNSTPLAGYTPNEPVDQTFTAVIEFTVTNWINTTSVLAFGFVNVGVLESYVNYAHSDAEGNGTFTATISARTITELFQTIEVDSTFVGVTINSAVIINEVTDVYIRGSEWNFSKNVPAKLKQLDVIKYVVNAFSLIIIPDMVNSTVDFVYFDDVPTNSPQDWSEKIDLSEDATIIPNYGDYKRNNVLEYDIDTGDSSLTESKELGQHTIVNSLNPEGQFTIYKAPFSLCNRVFTMQDTMTKAFIDLNTSESREEVITGINLTTVTFATDTDFAVDDELLFADCDGSQVINGTTINGQIVKVIDKPTSNTVTILPGCTGTPQATTGRAINIGQYYELNNRKPRIGVHKVVTDSPRPIQLIGAATVTSSSEVYFEDITWSSLVSTYWNTLSAIIQSPQMVRCLMRLSALDIHGADFTRPKYLSQFGCLFYLSYIDQFKTNQVDSTEVELVRLP
jgi:hypothetical protein